MMKHWIIALAAPLVLAGQPVAAQDEAVDDELAKEMAAFSQAYNVEPLTAEQEARLPLARSVIDQVIPAGSMNALTSKMFDGLFGPMSYMAETTGPNLSDFIGYDKSELALTDGEAAEIAAIVDPAWQERQRIGLTVTQDVVRKTMVKMEPAMREGMSEAYAANFTTDQLNDLKTFFDTPTGSVFARKSLELASDPRMVRASMAMMPEMMQEFSKMEEAIAAATASLPERRTFETLSPAQKKQLMKITGLSEEDLEIGMMSADFGYDEYDEAEEAADVVEAIADVSEE